MKFKIVNAFLVLCIFIASTGLIPLELVLMEWGATSWSLKIPCSLLRSERSERWDFYYNRKVFI